MHPRLGHKAQAEDATSCPPGSSNPVGRGTRFRLSARCQNLNQLTRPLPPWGLPRAPSPTTW